MNKLFKKQPITSNKDKQHQPNELYSHMTQYGPDYQQPSSGSESDWVMLTSGGSSEEEITQRSIKFAKAVSQRCSNSLSTTGLDPANLSSRTRSKTADGAPNSACSLPCKGIIKNQQQTISQLTYANEFLIKQMESLMKRNHELEQLKSSSSASSEQATQPSEMKHVEKIRRKSTSKSPRPSSEPALFRVSIDEIDLCAIMEKNKKFRRKKPASRRRKISKEQSCSATFEITFEDQQMNSLRDQLCERLYGDDIYGFFRYFHSNPDQFVADLKKTQDSSREKFHRAFAELRKLGCEKFNPNVIYEYFVKVEYNQYAEVVQPFLNNEDQSKLLAQPEKDSGQL